MNQNLSSTDVYSVGKKYGYLPYMIKRYVKMLGEEETEKLLHFYEKELHKVIRLNSLRMSYPKIVERLSDKKIELRDIPDIDEGKEVVNSPVPIGATPEYLNGYYMLQGKNSMYPPKVLNPREGELVGDFAAAPGGKTTHLAQLMKNKGTIIAFEISANRCRSLKSNLARMGAENVITLQMDSRNVTDLEIKYDKILLDAPCSGSGIINSDPSRKSSKSLQDIKGYHNYQVSLLKEAVKSLKRGGEIVYCTCSLEPEENELVISEILMKFDLDLQEIKIPGESALSQFEGHEFHPEISLAKRLYPHKTNGEGFFITKMVKK